MPTRLRHASPFGLFLLLCLTGCSDSGGEVPTADVEVTDPGTPVPDVPPDPGPSPEPEPGPEPAPELPTPEPELPEPDPELPELPEPDPELPELPEPEPEPDPELPEPDPELPELPELELPEVGPELDPGPDVPDPDPDPGPELPPDEEVDVDIDPGAFDGHTLASFDTLDAFLAYAKSEDGASFVKFTLTAIDGSATGENHFMDPTFYALHDEWYWFRLLNGVAIDGWDEPPVEGLTFPTIASVYEYYADADELPLDLVKPGSRIYSPGFYKDALSEDRFFGVGNLYHFPEDPDRPVPEALWAFTLEYVDTQLDEAILQAFFARIEPSLPPGMGPDLYWLTRSDDQEGLAAVIEAGDGPLVGRTLTWSDLAHPPVGEPLSRAITAGRLRILDTDPLPYASIARHDLVVLPHLPPDLPPVAGVILTAPPSPLSPTLSRARSARYPVVHWPDALDHPGLQDWANFKQPVALDVPRLDWEPVTIAPLSDTEYSLWKLGSTAEVLDVAPAPADGAWTLELTTAGGLLATDALLPLVGLHAVGFLAVHDALPAQALGAAAAITPRAWADHIAKVDLVVEAMLAEEDFIKDRRVRYLVLEGADAFTIQHAGDSTSLTWKNWYVANHGAETTLGGILAAGGLRQMLTALPVDAEALDAIAAGLDDAFSAGTAFRLLPSSTVDHLGGLAGPGLYASADPEPLEDALRQVWASWWSFAATEARIVQGLPHDGGGLAILALPWVDEPAVHGAARVAINAYGGAHLEVAAQVGGLSPTAPAPGELVEHATVDRPYAAAETEVEHQQLSSAQPDLPLLADEDLLALFDAAETLAIAWRDHLNASLDEARAWRSLELELSFRLDAGGNLTVLTARRWQPRLDLPEDVLDGPVPRDVLPEVDEVRLAACDTDLFIAQTLDLWRGNTWCPDPGEWAQQSCPEPFFNGDVAVLFTDPVPELGIDEGTWTVLDHTQALIAHPFMHHGGYDLYVDADADAGSPFDTLDVVDGSYWSLSGDQYLSGDSPPTCLFQQQYQHPGQGLRWVLYAP